MACTIELKYTVKPVYKEHPKETENVVLIDRFINMYIASKGVMKSGLYKHVVFIYRWSLEQISLY